jgi:hypothetical protein
VKLKLLVAVAATLTLIGGCSFPQLPPIIPIAIGKVTINNGGVVESEKREVNEK